MRVFIGLSGGVDSAVSAALLKEQGHEVIGCFIKIWQPEFIECSWREDRLDAMRVAAHLEIPFREIDLSDEYRREVVDTMISEYERGLTPNPDVLCNRSIKFGHFFRWAHSEGADFVATGHYARIQRTANSEQRKVKLLRGKDTSKDQSYFLAQVSEGELRHALFPIGELQKGAVRSLANKFGLPNATKPDSQGLCFVGEITLEDFFTRFIPLQQGPVRDVEGKLVGSHSGAALYTIGQRHGFTISSARGPHYVIRIDAKENALVVSPQKEDAAIRKVSLKNVHWITKPELPGHFDVQTRYREATVRALVSEEAARFDDPHIVAPGQLLVIYNDQHCLGSGSIARIVR